ncbi:MAG TPA: hypothetical protein VGG70_01240 [Candidatus Cybelea sp.]
MLRCETIAAINRPARPRLERYLGYVAALAARRLEHFARSAAGAASASSGSVRGPAVIAAAGLVGKALLGKKRLLAGGERKRAPAVAAGQGFIGVH